MTKLSVCIICGGRSAEHEISLLSTRNVLAALDRRRYALTLVAIGKDGTWRHCDEDAFLLHADDPNRIALAPGGVPLAVACRDGRGELVAADGTTRYRVDVAFPVLHGTYGEDGAIQGLLSMMRIPCVGCDLAGSAICMDKDVAKKMLVHANIDVARGITVTRAARDHLDAAAVLDGLGLPLFVKPARLGSSVGVTRIDTVSDLPAAVDNALRYDTKVLIEEAVPGREIECAVLGNDAPRASVPGEVIPAETHGFYSYEAKYLDANGAALCAPADLAPETAARVRQTALDAFVALECRGMARVDVFLCANGRVVVNEINTIPGFTAISMYPRLWALSGLSPNALVDELIRLALERAAADETLLTDRHG